MEEQALLLKENLLNIRSILTNDKVDFYNSERKKINKKVFTLSDNEKSNEKGDFKDFMSKEIHEQPSTLSICLN